MSEPKACQICGKELGEFELHNHLHCAEYLLSRAEKAEAKVKEWKAAAKSTTFCPNCEKDTECTHVAELYECEECGEDFAKYIVGRGEPSKSDVSVTENVSKVVEGKGENNAQI